VLPVAALAVVACIGAGCSSSSSPATTTSTTSGSASTTATTAGGGSSSAPGVTATQIDIGAISTKTGPIAGYFSGLSAGMIAYFDALDHSGGINGRKLVLAYDLDDGGQPSQFTQLTHTLIDQDHAFAVGVGSPWFNPSYFVSTGTPTYGYNVTSNWAGPPNLFAVGGSTQIYSDAVPTYAYFAQKTNSKSLAFISYGPSVTASYGACNTAANEMKANGYTVSFVDVGAQLGGSYASDVQRMQQAGSDLVVSCMQASDNITLARDIQQYGLKITQLWLNGYDQKLLSQYSSLMQGVYLNNTANVPFEAGDTAKFGDTYPGMQQYLADMKQYEPADVQNNVSFAGWQSAALIAAGIKAAGTDVTQANVIAQTNRIADFTADGTSAPVDWTSAHTSGTVPICSAWIQVKGSTFVSVFAPGKQVFVCVSSNVKHPAVEPAPAGTPGA
jgi:ABC-type branched-subunit amino acid transport system substrate-binding protein